MSVTFSATQIEYLQESLSSGSLAFEPIFSNASNHAMKLVTPKAEYLVKTFTTDALYVGNRQDVFDLQTQLNRAKLAPEPILYNPKLNLWLEKWVPSASTSQTRQTQIKALAITSAAIHQFQPLVCDNINIDLPQNWRRYLQIVSHSFSVPDAFEAFQTLLENDTDRCFCHNDLSLSHLLNVDPHIVVDWEYAGLGHRVFDLASTIKINDMSSSEQELFLQAYAAKLGMDTSYLSKKVSDMKPIVDFTYNLWHNAFNELN